MILIPDDPIIASIERTGYPWWMREDADYRFEDEDEDDDGLLEDER